MRPREKYPLYQERWNLVGKFKFCTYRNTFVKRDLSKRWRLVHPGRSEALFIYTPVGILNKEDMPMNVIGIISLCVAFFSVGYVLGKDINRNK